MAKRFQNIAKHKTEKPAASPLRCAYCGSLAIFSKTSDNVYRKDYGAIWICNTWPQCDAFVGCHPDGSPLGRLANKTLRKLKIQVHASLDALWRAKMERDQLKQGHARGKAYKWLAGQMGIDTKECHIGMFDEERCRQALAIVRPWADRLRTSTRNAQKEATMPE